MRMLHTFSNHQQALLLSGYLYLNQIETQVDLDNNETHVWVIADDDLFRAQSLLEDFLKNPQDVKYAQAFDQAKARALQEEKKLSQKPSGVIDIRTQWNRSEWSLPPVTLTLVIICVIVALLTQMGSSNTIAQWLYITEFQVVQPYLQWNGGLPEVLHGQVWRLITPIFLHFGFLHILFNLMWLKDLGGVIEQKQGSLFLIFQILLIGILSNLGQYFWSGPSFGGMSGVVYGLMGYLWIRGKLDPWFGIILQPSTVIMMIIWFFLCLFGLIGNVANGAHAVGLLTGMAWGFIAAQIKSK
ncbi:MAG: rhomboid family intramembrane serine protease [Deltaproteobacteria bacterium]|nr:rhomboid family intramembrane serine protease [Deltaproteobacteria bacterium]